MNARTKLKVILKIRFLLLIICERVAPNVVPRDFRSRHHLGLKIGAILFFFLTFLAPINSSAQITPLQRQDQIIRNQQDSQRRQRTIRELENIEQEHLRLKKEQENRKKQPFPQAGSKKCFKINQINFSGIDSFSQRKIDKISADFLTKCFSSQSLSELMRKITKYYHDRGFVTAQVTVPRQNLLNNILRLKISEGKVAEIDFAPNGTRQKLQKLSAFGLIEGRVLNLNDIHQGIFQINRLASNDASMKVTPGASDGLSNIIVTNKKSHPFRGNISYDNLGNEFTGIRRVGFSGGFDNLLSLNDQINLSYVNNFDDKSKIKDLRAFSVGLNVPFSYYTFSYDYSNSKYRGQNQGDNGPVSVSGYSDSSNIGIERLLFNSAYDRISSRFEIGTKKTASYINKNKIEPNERKLSIASLSFIISKYFKNGANIYLRPQYSRGLKVLNAKKDPKRASADIPKAQFQVYKLYGQVSKRAKFGWINAPILLSTEFSGQIAKDTLYGSEQFQVGGYHSVRGFRENFISGDHGYYFRNKLGLSLGSLLTDKAPSYLSKVTLEPFYDFGAVKTKFNSDSGRLSGAGLKAIYSDKYFSASATYSWGINRSSLIDSQDKENKMLYFEVSLKCC